MGNCTDQGVRSVFIVSTIGQITNAVKVVDALHLNNPYFVYLYSRHNMLLADRLENLLLQFEFRYSKLEIPRNASLKLPWQILKISQAVKALSETLECGNLWISNTNNHYAYLAHHFTEKGFSINFFEEGLGSYINADELELLLPPKITLSKFVKSLTLVVRRKNLEPYKYLRGCAKQATIILNKTLPTIFLNQLISGNASQQFSKDWIDFDHVVATYPEILDTHRFRAKKLMQLNPSLDPISREVKCALSTSKSLKALSSDCSAIFISQDYGLDLDELASDIAKGLRLRGLEEVFVKFHPKEKLNIRSNFLQALSHSGLIIYEDKNLDEIPAEFLVSACDVKNFVGLTSTALLRIATSNPKLRVHSLGHQIAERLEGHSAISRLVKNTFTVDVMLFDRIALATGTSIEYWRAEQPSNPPKICGVQK